MKVIFSLLLAVFCGQLWAQDLTTKQPSLLTLGYTWDSKGNSAGVVGFSTPNGFIGLLQIGVPNTLDLAQVLFAKKFGGQWLWGVGLGANCTAKFSGPSSITSAVGPQVILASPTEKRLQFFAAARPVWAHQYRELSENSDWQQFTFQISGTVSWQFSATLPLMVTGYYAFDGVNNQVPVLGGHIGAIGLTYLLR